MGACLLSAVRFAAARPGLSTDLDRGLIGEPDISLGLAGEAVAMRLPLRFDGEQWTSVFTSGIALKMAAEAAAAVAASANFLACMQVPSCFKMSALCMGYQLCRDICDD